MLQGTPGWEDTGNTLVASYFFITNGNVVLIDLRSLAESSKGHIDGAVNIPLAALPDAQKIFPASKAAPLVLYGNGNDAATAVPIIKGWGYHKVVLVDGGLAGWTAAGNKLVAGPPATAIHWVRKLGVGEVGTAEFKQAMLTGATDNVLLDVRSDDEVAAGMFSQAIHIPLEQLGDHLDALRSGKEIFIYCASGSRAEMARQVLEKAGIKSRFLKAEIKCKEGRCVVEE